MPETDYFVGVSGFSYSSWKGTFYPKELKSEDFLSYYAERLNSVEINSSFYAAPSASTVKSWAARAKGDFRFSFKAPKQITHVLKLGNGAAEAADRLSSSLGSMGERRGPILFQLPPFARQDTKLLDGFLSETRGIEKRVFEFRHASWLEESTYRLLEKHAAGFCIADTEEMAPEFRVCGGLAYFRLRKESYDAKTLDSWAKRIKKMTGGSSECYVYLRHDETGENGVLAQRLEKKIKA